MCRCCIRSNDENSLCFICSRREIGPENMNFECGLQHTPVERIVGGAPVLPGQFPWQVSHVVVVTWCSMDRRYCLLTLS